MSRFDSFVAVCLILCVTQLPVAVLGGSKCFWVDGDCKANPLSLPSGATGPAQQWFKMLKATYACAGKSKSSCKGNCAFGQYGCYLKPEAIGILMGTFAQPYYNCYTKTSDCTRDPDCKVGAKGRCVSKGEALVAIQGLDQFFPKAVPNVKLCASLASNPTKCKAT